MFEVVVNRPSEVIKKLITVKKYADTARFYLHRFSDIELNEGYVAKEAYNFTEGALSEIIADRLDIDKPI